MLPSLLDSDTENLPNRIHRKQANTVNMASEKSTNHLEDQDPATLVFLILFLEKPVFSFTDRLHRRTLC